MARKKYADDEDIGPSRSQKKRESAELQDLGKELGLLSNASLARLPLTEDLLAAIAEYKKITHREAKRRQMQYIGKLVRESQETGLIETFHELRGLRLI